MFAMQRKLITHKPRPMSLLILDGWGYREDPEDNAFAQARACGKERGVHDMVLVAGAVSASSKGVATSVGPDATQDASVLPVR
jgi:hypothetical protein